MGSTLTDALDEMVTNSTLHPKLAMSVLSQYDKSMNEALTNRVRSKVQFKGHLHTYRFCDNVWTFILEGAEFKSTLPGAATELVKVDKVKIVACDGKVTAK
mmetsp:Transcript_12651/g.17296  ORF Transcript_12651/g.17296 Transcript_12651/m.17296 type:complete len:101 (+) Transcript_12651:250-552(+)|eukprot:CAMPEP_0196579232 /NCGR_PEP_ID=MMETSP1081-20130531/19548_1 /TAXON_ID=36882 /ORGANISM="Pyramimonas amylifera, Strain CCMP720" /LENGTH=100 /DNA_ID=CAMNT_0041898749 /DNA_START=102 /DNA_END=404 /DNA_ORIENTATION=+